MSEQNRFFIVTDSSADLPDSLISGYQDFAVARLTFIVGDQIDPPMDSKGFYDFLREGGTARTSQVTPGQFLEIFQNAADAGMDVLYIGFSGGLSGTVGSGITAANMLRNQYPERKFVVVDSLSASLGQGCLVDKAVQLRAEGKSIDETALWLEDHKLKLNHWYTVDDLHFLHRGGRVSASAAWFGSTLKIKPVMNMDNSGHLIPVEKVIGRKRSIRTLFQKMKELGVDQSSQKIFISHGDCFEEANSLADMIREEWPGIEVIVGYVGNVIGSHTGPGVIALYFFGNKR